MLLLTTVKLGEEVFSQMVVLGGVTPASFPAHLEEVEPGASTAAFLCSEEILFYPPSLLICSKLEWETLCCYC